MAKSSPIQQSFNAGELSPLLYARTDFDKYKSGVKTLKNYIPLVQGPITRRSGTRFVAEVKDNANPPRLIPFEFSTEQAYIIEMGAGYFRFYRDNGAITEAAISVTGITQANPAVVTAVGHNLATGQHTEIDSVVGMTEVNGKRFQVTVLTANTYELDGIDSTGFTAYSSGGNSNKIYEISHNIGGSLDAVSYTQTEDTMYFAASPSKILRLTRTGHTGWTTDSTLFDYSIGVDPDGPYFDINNTTTTLIASAATGSGVTLTASSVAGINGGGGFQSLANGQAFRIWDEANSVWGVCRQTAYTSTTIITVDVTLDSLPVIATDLWRQGVDNPAAVSGPRKIAFFEDRLVMVGISGYRGVENQRIDMSNTGDYSFFAPTEPDGTVIDSNAVSFSLKANNVNVVQWILDDPKGLVLGATGGEWLVKASINQEALTPSNVNASRSTNHGCHDSVPARVGAGILHIQKSKLKLRELLYSFDIEGFASVDKTVLAEHITSTGINKLSYQQEPHSILWAVREDGQLVGFTYEKGQDVAAWHNHIIGGHSDSGGTTPAKVHSIASIPSADGTRDELWCTVERYINGGTKYYVEFLEKTWEHTDLVKDSFFIDSGLSYSGSAITTVSGLDHLEGETVKILADAAVIPDAVVSGGSITIPTAAEDIHVGLSFNSDIETLSIEAGAKDGTAIGKTKRIHRVIIKVLDMLGLKFGPDEDNLDEYTFRQAGDDMDTGVPLFTGDIEIEWNGDYDKTQSVFLRQSDPLPGTILAIAPHMNTQDR